MATSICGFIFEDWYKLRVVDFPADLDHLYEMLGYIREHAQATGMSAESLHRIELMSEEALVNVISYAFSEKSEGRLSIICETVEKSLFQVILKDRGAPFNPLQQQTPDSIHKPLEERQIGGLGIYMMRKLADKLLYAREGGENVLTMGVKIE